MTYVLGIDSSTQSCKAVLVDAASGEIVDQARASHPGGTQVDPTEWIAALEKATDGLLKKADAVAVAGQQHGKVALDKDNHTVRAAMLWNDVSSADAAAALVDELGGPKKTVDLPGSVLVGSVTRTKLRWLRDNEPDNASGSRRLCCRTIISPGI